MANHPWRIDQLNLPAYLSAIGLSAREPNLDALAELHEAHVRTFPFENFDVLLGNHPGVELPVVQEKLVGRGRGGYCFEHGVLFSAALERLGYDVRRHLGRVGDVTRVARTHFVVVVTLDGRRHLCDPGFGMSLLRPIRLADGAELDDGWRYQVVRVDTGAAGPVWQLHRHRESGWELLHTTDELPVHPVDVAMGHHFTSTAPASHFTHGLMMARQLDGRHVTVTHEAVTIRRTGAATEHRSLREGELLKLMDELGTTLPRVDRERLASRFEAGT